MDRDNGRRAPDGLRVERAAAALLAELDRLLERDDAAAPATLGEAAAAAMTADRRQDDGRRAAADALRRDVAERLSGGTTNDSATANDGRPTA